MLSPRPVVEAALAFTSREFSEELDQPYPHPFRLEAISEELMTTSEVYAMSSPKPEPIPRHAVADLTLACWSAEAYEVTVACKCGAYLCWTTCQVTLWSLIEMILPIVS